MQASINAARGQLPANLPNKPTDRKVNPAEAPILSLTLTSETMDISRVYDAAAYWMKANPEHIVEDLRRFRAEAAELLGIDDNGAQR